MGRYKPKITDLSLQTLEMLVLIKDGHDVLLKQEATFIRELDAKFPGIVKIGPPMFNRNALFSVRCPPKGQILVETYIARKAQAQIELVETYIARKAEQITLTGQECLSRNIQALEAQGISVGPVDEMQGAM